MSVAYAPAHAEEAPFEFRRPAWQAQANCHPDVIPDVWQQYGKHPVDMFYPEGPVTLAQRRDIESVCEGCPVRGDCEYWGLLYEEHGYWGSRTPRSQRQRRGEQGITVHAPEVDHEHGRQVIGTFILPGHGTIERYNRHRRAGEQACDACRWAYGQEVAPVRMDHKRRQLESMTEAERTEYVAQERAREAQRVIRRRKRGW